MGAIAETIDTAKLLLASPRGRAARATLAAGVIAAAPLVMRLPAVRQHPIGRLLALAGGATVIVKLADAVRDWEPAVRSV